jgi:hypothetical protein
MSNGNQLAAVAIAQRMVGESVEAMGIPRRAINPSGHRF